MDGIPPKKPEVGGTLPGNEAQEKAADDPGSAIPATAKGDQLRHPG